MFAQYQLIDLADKADICKFRSSICFPKETVREFSQTKRVDLQIRSDGSHTKQVIFKTPPLDLAWPVRVIKGDTGEFCSIGIKKDHNLSGLPNTFDSEGYVSTNHDFSMFIETVFHPKCVAELPECFFELKNTTQNEDVRQMIKQSQIPCPAKSSDKNTHGMVTGIRVNFNDQGELVIFVAKFSGYTEHPETKEKQKKYEQLNPVSTLSPGQVTIYFTVHAYRQKSGKSGLVLTAQQLYVEVEHNTSLTAMPLISAFGGNNVIVVKREVPAISPSSTSLPENVSESNNNVEDNYTDKITPLEKKENDSEHPNDTDFDSMPRKKAKTMAWSP